MAETFDFITVTTPNGSVQYKAPPMAAEFSASTSYAAGDYCTYQGALYRFSAAHAAGAWTGTDAAVVSLAGDVSDLRSAIEDVSGLSDEVKEALLACFANVAWIGDDGQDYYNALYQALYNTTWAITNNLTNCTTSNESVQTIKGSAYSATITASTGYVMTGATVSITMGGTDITATAYSNGTITIAAVTGALVITISAAAKTVSSISAVYTQSGTVYDIDTLDSLKTDLVVTATYTDSSTEVVPSADYTLSGTLTAGTSTVTVTYSGKTTTFSVTVTALTLDDIAYGTYSYRDIFITNNKLSPLGDFETPVTLSSSEVNIGNNLKCKINAGTPEYSTEAYDSPTHSLKCFGSTSTQLRCRDSSTSYPSGSVFLGCVSVKVDRAAAGEAGLQITFPYNSVGNSIDLGTAEVTDGFEQHVGILTLTANRTGCQLYPGTRNSANMDCYVDDVVLTPAPSGITEAEALDVYNKYLFIKRRDAA